MLNVLKLTDSIWWSWNLEALEYLACSRSSCGKRLIHIYRLVIVYQYVVANQVGARPW